MTREGRLVMEKASDQPWWINSTDRPEWFGELCKAFVEAGVASWDGSFGKPHPQEPALVAIHFFSQLDDADGR